MTFANYLPEAFLLEDVALTKGSQRVMSDKTLVSGLAARVRRDADFNPSVFPPNADRKFEKAPDEDVAKWFLENIDKIEKEGYEGTIYSRDGMYSDWIVRRYIAGSHNWEDLKGVMNMNLRDWTILKNRNELDPAHKEVSKFKSVREIGAYMVHHYQDKLEDVRNAAKFAARDKMARAIPLVNNADYKITVALNRAAACKLGSGTQWCTANSTYGDMFKRYAGEAMLYQMYPAVPETISKKSSMTGKEITGKEKYQFGPDSGLSFKDIADENVKPEDIRTKFPYLYTDLVTALKQNKAKVVELEKTFSEDPALQDPDMSKIRTYNVDEEITKLKKFITAGYMTDEVRPKEHVEKDDAGQEQPQLSPPVETPPQAAPMESITEFARRMSEGKTNKDELDEEDLEDTDSDLGSMGAGAGPTGGGKFPPGTAPTMPESFNNKGTEIMENVDKDVAAMLKNLKKYDTLVESCAPVLMARPKPYIAEKEEVEEEDFFHNPKVPANKQLKAPPKEVNIEEGEEDKKNPWEDLGKDKEEKEAQPGDETTTHKGGKVTKTTTGLVHRKVDESTDVADPEVLEWMSRFSKLGNMKGYGR
jgi:hypothetical protein